MNDTLPTVWDADAHTLAKHKILAEYLCAWMPIMTKRFQRGPLRYIDAFAGPGAYTDGSPGSPIIALKVALGWRREPFARPIDATFVEQDAERHALLTDALRRLADEHGQSPNVRWQAPVLGDGETVLRQMLDRPGFGPALVFLDQFGYSQVSMDLIGAIIRCPSSEVFAFLNWRDMNRWMNDPNKAPGITRAFGGDEWRTVFELPESKRQAGMLAAYETALEKKAGVRYRCRFDMRDKNDKLLYWLFFCSSSPRGLEEMKRAMWKVDETGQFHFSDRHAGQPFLLKGFTQEWLAGALFDQFDGQELTVRAIFEHVLVHTPCYQYNTALGHLERSGDAAMVNPPEKRRRGSFAKYLDDENVRVRFAKKQP